MVQSDWQMQAFFVRTSVNCIRKFSVSIQTQLHLYQEAPFETASLLFGIGGAKGSFGVNVSSTKASTNPIHLSDRLLRYVHNEKYIQSVEEKVKTKPSERRAKTRKKLRNQTLKTGRGYAKLYGWVQNTKKKPSNLLLFSLFHILLQCQNANRWIPWPNSRVKWQMPCILYATSRRAPTSDLTTARSRSFWP